MKPKPISSPYLVPTDGSFSLAAATTAPSEVDPDKHKKRLKKRVGQIAELQEKLYADDRFSLLLIFQAMDAAGKDSTIKKVMSGVNPAGFQVYAFKQPSAEELDHDFLWRSAMRLPERGRIGVFNRSYYEEVLVVRVHPEYLGRQKLPYELALDDLWEQRFSSIRDHEKHLSRSGTAVVKFFLHVSQAEQQRRFVARIEEDEKNWKFSAGDIAESRLWDKYQHAYGEALRITSRDHAPWYCVPADDKPYARMVVADILQKTLESLPLRWPQMSTEDRQRMQALHDELAEGSSK